MARLQSSKGQVLAHQIIYAHSFFKRIKGLIGYKNLERGRALWIRPCDSIHTCFMKFSIDVIFVDQNLCIQSIYKNISPWRIVHCFSLFKTPLRRIFSSTHRISAFEFKGGYVSQYSLKQGDHLHVGA